MQPYTQPSRTPVSFTPDQINALCAQIYAFKSISRGLPPLPESIQQAIRVLNSAILDFEKLLQRRDINARLGDNTVRAQIRRPSAFEAFTQDALKTEDQDVASNPAN
jgi:ATP-dependent helicase STH1/SNF2